MKALPFGSGPFDDKTGLPVTEVLAIQPDWIDYNGHMNVAYYVKLFDMAVDELFERSVGMGKSYIETRNLSFFTVDLKVRYLREVQLTDPVQVRMQFIAHDDKRLHIYSELFHATEGWLSATCEMLLVHVDMATRKVARFPDDIAANLSAMVAAHMQKGRPQDLGRPIEIKQKS